MEEIKKIKDNWRQISKSDYLASIDVNSIIKCNSGRCILTIKDSVQHLAEDDAHLPSKQQFRLNGTRGSWNIIHFEQNVKPMSCNVTNSQILWRFRDKGRAEDESVRSWIGLTIELAVDMSVEFAGNRGGIIVMSDLPVVSKPELSPSHADWDGYKIKIGARIIERVDEGMEIEDAKLKIRKTLEEHFSISNESWEMLCK